MTTTAQLEHEIVEMMMEKQAQIPMSPRQGQVRREILVISAMREVSKKYFDHLLEFAEFGDNGPGMAWDKAVAELHAEVAARPHIKWPPKNNQC